MNIRRNVVEKATLRLGVGALLLISVGIGTAQIAISMELRLGVGEDTPPSWDLGNEICQSLNEAGQKEKCSMVEIADEKDLLTNLHVGSLDLAILDSQLLHNALHAQGGFTYATIQYDNLAVISPLHDVPISLIAKVEILHESNQKNQYKWLNGGPSLSPENQALDDLLLQVKGWQREDFSLITKLTPPESKDAMTYSTGNIQAMVHKGIHPDPAFEHLFSTGAVEIVNMSREKLVQLIAQNPGYVVTEISPESYDAISKPTTTLAARVILVTTREMDHDLAYAIAKILHGNEEKLQKCHLGCSSMKIRGLNRGEQPVDTHPGAAAYFAGFTMK